MNKFSHVSVLYRDVLVSHPDLIFYRSSPKSLSVSVDLRGNELCTATLLCAGQTFTVDLAQLPISDGTLSIDPAVWKDCSANNYAVLVLRFSHGQDARIPVYIAETAELPRIQKIFPLPVEDETTYRFPNGESIGPIQPDGGLPITYDFTRCKHGNTARMKLGAPRPVTLPRTRTVRMTLKGDASYQRISMRFNNGYNATVYSANSILLDFDDVRTLEFEIPADAALPFALNDVIRITYSPGCRTQKGRLVLYELYALTEEPDLQPSQNLQASQFPPFPGYTPPPLPLCSSEFISAAPSRILRAMTENPATSAAFSCVTDGPVCTLYYRRAESSSAFQPISANTEWGFEEEDGQRVRICYHKFYLCGLTPDTTYEYRLDNGPIATFRTFPTAPESVTALFFTDVQIGSNAENAIYFDRFRQVIEQEVSETDQTDDPRFFISLGDIVQTAADCREYEQIVRAGGKHFRDLPIAATVGNHEYDDYDFFDVYTRRNAFPSGTDLGLGNSAYSFTIGDYTFFAVTLVSGDLTPVHLDRLEQVLADCNSKWKIVLLHCSPYTGVGGFFRDRHLVAPLFERCGVDIVFSGHSHIYIRASVWQDRAVSPENGILYLTMGTTSHRMSGNDRGFWQDYVFGDREDERRDAQGMPDSTCATARFSTDGVSVSVRTLSGKVIDDIIVKK